MASFAFGFAEPRIAKIGVRPAVNRNLNLQPVIGRREHHRLAFQLYRLPVFLDWLCLPEDGVIAAEVAADRAGLDEGHAEQPRLGTRDLPFFLVVIGGRAPFESALRALAFDLAFVYAVGRLLVCLFAFDLPGGTER